MVTLGTGGGKAEVLGWGGEDGGVWPRTVPSLETVSTEKVDDALKT
jgi:hypothetical protein